MMYQSDAQVLAASTIERRGNLRLDCSYPAQVRFHGMNGAKVEKGAIISNLSATGMYLRFDHRFELGEGLFIVARVLEEPSELYRPFLIASQGVVVRCESRADGQFGVAIKINQRRFLSEQLRQTKEQTTFQN
ncbi:MAG: PilZ domain-containing protein [Chloroflexi bacterium]|nr:PilZ domain-containing protein [Chloroflexota bacterium]